MAHFRSITAEFLSSNAQDFIEDSSPLTPRNVTGRIPEQ